VHRLDKDTSGVLLVAKDQRILERLAHAFKERRVQKTYVAVVVGRFSSPGGEIALPIGRHPVERKKMWVNARQGRAAVSRYQVIAEAQGLTLVRMFPETGRTHQLRVHLAAVGHPIVGDKMYGASHIGSRRLPVVARAFSRQALHAVALAFSHPVSGEPVQFQAPYPADFLELVKIFVAENKSAKEGLLPVDDKKKIGYVRT
jgi:23S rRNA pseudouridine1911/1915/1917 synthase